MRKLGIMVICLVYGTLGYPGTSHAYLDPGTGSILLQAIVGSVAAGAAVIGLYWRRLKSLFVRNKAITAEHSESGDKDPS